LHQVGDLFELNVKLRCQKINRKTTSESMRFSVYSRTHKNTHTHIYICSRRRGVEISGWPQH